MFGGSLNPMSMCRSQPFDAFLLRIYYKLTAV